MGSAQPDAGVEQLLQTPAGVSYNLSLHHLGSMEPHHWSVASFLRGDSLPERVDLLSKPNVPMSCVHVNKTSLILKALRQVA